MNIKLNISTIIVLMTTALNNSLERKYTYMPFS
jgi:hypothetical protein